MRLLVSFEIPVLLGRLWDKDLYGTHFWEEPYTLVGKVKMF